MKKLLMDITLTAFVVVGHVAIAPSLVRAADMTLDDAAAEIALLKQVVAEQDKRITALEQALASSKTGDGKADETSKSSSRPTSPPSGAPLKTASNWDRIKDGMSKSQVIAILGEPTSRDDESVISIFYYEGDVAASGNITGNIKFVDGRVNRVNKPVF